MTAPITWCSTHGAFFLTYPGPCEHCRKPFVPPPPAVLTLWLLTAHEEVESLHYLDAFARANGLLPQLQPGDVELA